MQNQIKNKKPKIYVPSYNFWKLWCLQNLGKELHRLTNKNTMFNFHCSYLEQLKKKQEQVNTMISCLWLGCTCHKKEVATYNCNL